MATYTATISAVVTDPQKQNSNVYITVDFMNNSTQEKQQRIWFGDTVGLTASQLLALLQAWGLVVINQLKARDAAVTAITAAIGTASAVLGSV